MIRLLISVTLLMGSALAQPPTPTLPPGVVLGNPNAPVRIDIFYDFLCSDSAPNWPIMKDVLAEYKDRVNGVIHIMPLPYHHNAFFAAQGGRFFTPPAKSSAVFVQYMELMFVHQQEFLAAAANETEPEVKSAMAKLVSANMDVSYDDFLAALNNGGLNEDARVAWKYAVTQGIYGVPLFQINGITNQSADSFSRADWKKFLDQLLQ